MFRQGFLRVSTNPSAILALAALALSTVTALAVVPFNQATVTKVENLVSYGEVKSGKTLKRRAAATDVVRANNFLLTETESRAELQYEDGSVVRIGQNTVFSFTADTRTLALEKGSFIFYVPKGSGGGTIKTPSLTAAITGTIGKVSGNMIAILEGVVTLKPSGRQVPAGYFAVRNADGTITIDRFDMSKAWEGKLMNFNGPMPGFEENQLLLPPPIPDPHFDLLERSQNNPNSLLHFFPPSEPPPPADKNDNRVVVPPPVNTAPQDRPTPGRRTTPY